MATNRDFLTIRNNGVLFLRIDIDGSVEYGDAYDPDRPEENTRFLSNALHGLQPLPVTA